MFEKTFANKKKSAIENAEIFGQALRQTLTNPTPNGTLRNQMIQLNSLQEFLNQLKR